MKLLKYIKAALLVTATISCASSAYEVLAPQIERV